MSLLYRRRELFNLLAWHMHHDDWCPGDTLLRLAEKAVGRKLQRGKIVVFEVEFTLRRLSQLQQDAHTNCKPARLDAPLILFRDDQRRLHVLDGQNRINYWRQYGVIGPHRCLIVKIKP